MIRNRFRNINEFRNSSLWGKLNSAPSKQNTRVFASTRLEDMIYSDLQQNIGGGLDELEAQGLEKLDTFPPLIRDTFQSVYSLNPRRNDADSLTANARKFNAEILDFIITSTDYPTLKALCEGRELQSYEAVNEFSEQMLEKLDSLLETAGGEKNSLKVLEKLEAQLDALQTKILDLIGQHGMGNLNGQGENELLDLATKAESKDRQIERSSQMVSQNMQKNKEAVQAVVLAALASAKEKAQETSDILASWGNGDSNPETLQQNAELLRRVNDSQKLKDIAKYLGRFREMLNSARKNSFAYGRGDKYDICLGNDYSRAFSSEYAYLAIPEAIPLFIEKVQKRMLKQYRKRERIIKGYGDIVVCVDESSSMKGDPIAWAKAVALVLMEYALQNERSCAVIRFGSKGCAKTHVFQKGKYTTNDILEVAESFLNSGTDFEEPLEKAVELIEQNSFQNADIAFLTDGECAVSEEFSKTFQEKSKALNFSVTGIVMDAGSPGMTFSLTPFCGKIYRLSELSCDNVISQLISAKIA